MDKLHIYLLTPGKFDSKAEKWNSRNIGRTPKVNIKFNAPALEEDAFLNSLKKRSKHIIIL